MPSFSQEDESCILDKGGQVSREELSLKDLSSGIEFRGSLSLGPRSVYVYFDELLSLCFSNSVATVVLVFIQLILSIEKII